MKESVQRGRLRRGRPLSPRRIPFRELLDQGMTLRQACLEIGINERTGRDWAKGIVRNDHGRFTLEGQLVWAARGMPKVPPLSKTISARFLSVEERIEIADLHRARLTLREIARQLNRSPSTISRELCRNAHPSSGDYRPWAAQQRSAQRRVRPKLRKIDAVCELRDFIAEGLRRRWSPGTVLPPAQARLPRPAGDACDARDDLSGALCAGPR
jgi:IS30 family transposase